MPTFQELLQSDLDDVFLNTEEFGESVEYYPFGGAMRTITVAVSEYGARNEMELNAKSVSAQLRVFAKRDAVTGIDNPQQKDYLVRSSEPGVNYYFQRVLEQDSAGHELLFEKRARGVTGANESRRPQQS